MFAGAVLAAPWALAAGAAGAAIVAGGALAAPWALAAGAAGAGMVAGAVPAVPWASAAGAAGDEGESVPKTIEVGDGTAEGEGATVDGKGAVPSAL